MIIASGSGTSIVLAVKERVWNSRSRGLWAQGPLSGLQ